MPSIRIGFSTDFNLTGEQIGIGTTNPTARLDVAGQIRSDDSAGSGGVSTVTRYAGFLDEAQGLGNNVSIAETTKGNLNSLSGEIKISGEVTVTEDTKLTGGRLDSLTVTGKFDLPHGGSEDREDTPEKGSTRFNQDLGQLEFYTGYEWRTVNSYADIRNSPSGRGRGVFNGGRAPALQSFIGYVNISTLGNEQSFGNLTATYSLQANVASETRGCFGGGQVPTTVNTIEYITIASEGDSIDFGDLTSARRLHAAVSSSTRGVFGNADANVMDYITISTLGNALDFGDSTFRGGQNYTGRNYAACASPTRGIFAGGTPNPIGGYAPPWSKDIRYLTISSKGNTIDFGDLINENLNMGGLSSSVRGVFAGGSPSSDLNIIQHITIATLGNAQYFGDLTIARNVPFSSCNQTRGLFAGGGAPSPVNVIDYITITTAGDAQDFGDLSIPRSNGGISVCSDSHGGLGGF